MRSSSVPALAAVVLVLVLLLVFVVQAAPAHTEAIAPDAVAAAAPLASCPALAPPPIMTAQFDPTPARYSLPESNEPEPGYFLDAKGATTIYQDVGTLEGHLCPGGDTDYWFTQTGWVKHDPPTCWVNEPVKVSECPQPASTPTAP